MKHLSLLFLLAFLSLPLATYAQDEVDFEDVDTVLVKKRKVAKKDEPVRQISGRVLSQQDHAPLAGVLVKSIAGEGYSALTGEDGTFTMNVPLYSSALEVTIPGYNTVRVGLNESGQLRDIILQSDAARALYGADDNILNNSSTSDFSISNATNISTEIQSRLGADVLTNQRSGLTALGSYMQISGVGSYMINAQPLIVIDGVMTEMQYGREMLHQGFYNDVLANLNVNDIESVEVMKNGTAIYGAKGANGVIFIRTKRNSSLATRIDASASVGIEFVPVRSSVQELCQQPLELSRFQTAVV